jgi:hypothetical protein
LYQAKEDRKAAVLSTPPLTLARILHKFALYISKKRKKYYIKHKYLQTYKETKKTTILQISSYKTIMMNNNKFVVCHLFATLLLATWHHKKKKKNNSVIQGIRSYKHNMHNNNE